MSQALVPPHHLEAERSILGTLMLFGEAWDRVVDIVKADEFYSPAHQIIFQTIFELNALSKPVDLVTIDNALQAKGKLEQIGGKTYLVQLAQDVFSIENIEVHAQLVKEKALLRTLISSASKIIDRCYKQEFTDVESFVDEAEGEFFKIGDKNKVKGGLLGPLDVVKNSMLKIQELHQRKVDISGIASGFSHLDKMTSGFQPGELIIIAARPSVGKTAFSLNIAQHIALREKKAVAYFSVEMPCEQVMNRILSCESRINGRELGLGRVKDNEWQKLINVAGVISESRLFIDDTSGLSPFELRARVRRMKQKVGIDAIIIDYLQLMELKQKVESRERAVSEITKTLKAIAKELQIPVIALAQLNRSVESRQDRRPLLSDLRESGSIEQDADVIMMLYRDDYYDKTDSDKKGIVEINIAKQRNGPTGMVRLAFEAEYGRFRDVEPEVRSGPPIHTPPPAPSQNGGSSSGRPVNFAPRTNKDL